jgi:hypothetical protein
LRNQLTQLSILYTQINNMPESFAALRSRRSDELAKLADQHLQHDLRQEDRDTLKSAAGKVSFWTGVGSAVGIGLGLYVAFRLRSSRKAFFDVFRAQERPTQVVFADGRTGMELDSMIPGYTNDVNRVSSGYHPLIEANYIG